MSGIEEEGFEMESGVKRVLMGMEVTLFGGVLVLSASGSAVAIGLMVAVVGLVVALTGTADGPESR